MSFAQKISKNSQHYENYPGIRVAGLPGRSPNFSGPVSAACLGRCRNTPLRALGRFNVF